MSHISSMPDEIDFSFSRPRDLNLCHDLDLYQRGSDPRIIQWGPWYHCAKFHTFNTKRPINRIFCTRKLTSLMNSVCTIYEVWQQLVTDPGFFQLKIFPNIEPVCGKIRGQIISPDRRDNTTTPFATNVFNIRRQCERK